MKHALNILLLILTLISCKNESNSELNKTASEQNIEKESIDYHKIIDLIMENHSIAEIKLYNFEIKYADENNRETVNSLEYLLKNTDSKSQSNLLKKLISKKDLFVFNKTKLNSKTTEFINPKEIQSNDKIIYVFNSFLSNELNDSIVANISVLYTNEKHDGIKGGWEEIAFFSKENNNWKLDKRIEYIDY